MANKFEIKLIGNIENPKDDSVDVQIFIDSEEYIATFFTIANILRIIDKNRLTGERINGLYFWSSDMIIIEEINLENITLAINDLLLSGGFYQAVSPANELGKIRILKEMNYESMGEAFSIPFKVKK